MKIEEKTIIVKDMSQQSKPVEIENGRCLRDVPGRRAVYEGTCDGKPAVIKIFTSRLHGWRHFRRELHGLEKLKKRGIAAVNIKAYGKDAAGHYALVLEKIEKANDIHSLFQSREDNAGRIEILKLTLTLLARMHDAGIIQRDMHLGNFLWDGTGVYAMDSAQMRFGCRPVGRRRSLRQLAVLATNFMTCSPDIKKKLLDIYFQTRGWRLNDAAFERVDQLAQKTWRHGIERGLNKTLRSSKRFIRQKTDLCSGVFERTIFRDANLPNFMAGLDDAMEAGHILKRGNTCFVSKVDLNGRDIVVKRYNHKGLWHSLRHTLKGSRAKKCWKFGHRLHWLGIPTAKPLAFIELRKHGIIRQSWIINEFISGQNIRTFFNNDNVNEKKKQTVLEKTNALLGQLIQNKMTHGDLKSSNILIFDEKSILIDLDSMKRHWCLWMLRIYAKKMNVSFSQRIRKDR